MCAFFLPIVGLRVETMRVTLLLIERSAAADWEACNENFAQR